MITGSRHRFDERGQAAGIESIPFGVLIFIGGLLLMVNAWAVVDRRGSVDAAASAYLRSYSSASSADEGRLRGESAARASLGDQLETARALRIRHPAEPFGPCRIAEVVVTVEVPMVEMPFIGKFGRTDVSTTQRELVQPYGRARIASGSGSLEGTVCDG